MYIYHCCFYVLVNWYCKWRWRAGHITEVAVFCVWWSRERTIQTCTSTDLSLGRVEEGDFFNLHVVYDTLTPLDVDRERGPGNVYPRPTHENGVLSRHLGVVVGNQKARFVIRDRISFDLEGVPNAMHTHQ